MQKKNKDLEKDVVVKKTEPKPKTSKITSTSSKTSREKESI